MFQATLQVGGHGEKILQCSEVKLTTTKVIPMQVSLFTSSPQHISHL